MSNENPNPHEALASIRDARGNLGRELDYSAKWDVIAGTAVAALVGGQALPSPWRLIVLLGAMAILFVLAHRWKDQVGWWVNPFSPRRARRVAISLALIGLAMTCVALWRGGGDGVWWVAAIATVTTWIAAVVCFRLWMRAYRKDLQEIEA